MRIGIMPAPNSGLRTMAATGQFDRLMRHFTAYRAAGHELTYFTHLPDDPEWIASVRRPRHELGLAGAFLRPLREPRAFRSVDVLRVMSLAGSVGSVLARLVLHVPFVVSYGADYEALARLHGRAVWKWRVLRSLACRYASAVIVPNPEHAATLRERYPRARIAEIPNWVDTEMFRPAAARPSGPITVLYVGRLVLEKNLERLARVCRTQRWSLVCVGEGPLRPVLTAYGAACPGAVPWETLPDWYARAHVFVLPSYTEGHPKALLEAMASGLPCAVSTGVRGMIRPGWDAETFSPTDESTMATAIRGVKANAPTYGQNARITSSGYAIERVLPMELRLIEDAARSR